MSEQTNTIYSGDNVEVLRRDIPEKSIDLIYADPPFFSNKHYEVLWGDGYELRAFEDRWKGGIENYISWMELRLRECHRVLKDTGVMYLHCDYHADAYLRVLMDKIFGGNHFISEIIWRRKPQSATITSNTRSFGNNHDIILFYSKTKEYTFNRLTITKEVDKKIYQHDSKGYFKTAPAGNYSDKSLERMIEEGVAYKTKGNKIRKKYYLSLEGNKLFDTKPIDNIWFDIPNIMHVPQKERYGYPTQKPEMLLERIINASSHPIDIVLDPFCGCGTSIAVAHKLGRRWIGIDVSPTACNLIVKRMKSLGAKKIHLIGLPRTIEELKKLEPFEFQNWVFEKLHGRVNPKKTGDMGVDGWVNLDIPTQVKQSENIGRVDVDKFETAIRRYGKKQGVIVAFSFGSGAYEEVARVKNQEFPMVEITLKKVEEILNES